MKGVESYIRTCLPEQRIKEEKKRRKGINKDWEGETRGEGWGEGEE